FLHVDTGSPMDPYRMFVVYESVAISGTDHSALSRKPTAPIETARLALFNGCWKSHTAKAPKTAKIATTKWLMRHAVSSTAGSHNRFRVRSAVAKVPKKSSANAIAIVNEYSPASVLASVPPMMRWLNAIVVAADDDPGSPVKNNNAVDAIANAAGVGFG